MSWLNTLLDVGIISMQVNQREKLKQMQEQQAGAAAIQAVVQLLRDEIFKFKQAAEEILVLEEKNVRVAAGAMRVLYLRLQDFGITPDMFAEISDKEYVAATNKFIHENSTHLLTQLSPPEQTEVVNIADAALMLPRYNYYVDNYKQAQTYKHALPTYNKLKHLNNGCLVGCTGLTLLLMVPFLAGAVGTFVGALISEGMAAFLGLAGGAIGFIAVIAGIVFYLKKVAHQGEYQEAKTIVDQFKDKVDLEHFVAVEQELGNDYTHVLEQQSRAKELVADFFSNSDLSHMLPA